MTLSTRTRQAHEEWVAAQLRSLQRRWQRNGTDDLTAAAELVARLGPQLAEVAGAEAAPLVALLPAPLVAAAEPVDPVERRYSASVYSSLRVAATSMVRRLQDGVEDVARAARSLVASARSAGVRAVGSVASAFGATTVYTWKLSPGCDHCEICVGLNGETRTEHGTFSTGDDEPPSHENCCCGLETSWSFAAAGAPVGTQPPTGVARLAELRHRFGLPTDPRPSRRPSLTTALRAAQADAARFVADAATAPPPEWLCVVCTEGEMTPEGEYPRMIAPGALGHRALPIPLTWGETDGHMDDTVVGQVWRMWREGNDLMAEGTWDTGEVATEIRRKVEAQVVRWVSMVLDEPREYEVTDCSDDEPCEQVMTVLDADVAKVTIVDHPAFPGAVIVSAAAGIPPAEQGGRPASVAPAQATTPQGEPTPAPAAVAACAATPRPPASWFADPRLTEATPFTLTEDGRVYGCYAGPGCHSGSGTARCLRPAATVDYSRFHIHDVTTAEGATVHAGRIVVGGGHAPEGVPIEDVQRHYDGGSGAVAAADVVVGSYDDGHLWFSGALRPDCPQWAIDKLRGDFLSGDWRTMADGRQYLMAVLGGVLVPGLPVVPGRRIIASGKDDRLVASLG